jgi:hypothetical protein
MKRTLKLAAEAFRPANLARGLAARHPPPPEEIEVAHAAPRRRAADGAGEDARTRDAARRVLFGPAGIAVHGPEIRDQGPGLRFARVDVRTALRRPVPVADPARHAAGERVARERARAPYRAPARVPVHISRLTTRGRTQVDDVLGYLNSSGLAPDRIFGVYRVPDRISHPLAARSETGRPVEWDVVHSNPEGTSAPLEATSFAAGERWVARRVGDPSVLDEELALAFCESAGIGPEHCAGLARVSEFRALDEGGHPVCTLVRGVVAVHPRIDRDAYERMRAATPLVLPEPAGVHVEVLNWAAIAAAVHARCTDPPPVPSPFPHLPATPQELLRAYLEVVGVRPEDSFSAQATVDRVRALGGAATSAGPRQPCADGKDRARAHGCEHVVLVYRDRPEYVAGRARWAAYQADQLQARLERGTGVRRRVDAREHRLSRAAGVLERRHDASWFEEIEEPPAPYRYCWPPV